MADDEYQPATPDELVRRDKEMAEVFGADPPTDDDEDESPTHDLGGEA